LQNKETEQQRVSEWTTYNPCISVHRRLNTNRIFLLPIIKHTVRKDTAKWWTKISAKHGVYT